MAQGRGGERRGEKYWKRVFQKFQVGAPFSTVKHKSKGTAIASMPFGSR